MRFFRCRRIMIFPYLKYLAEPYAPISELIKNISDNAGRSIFAHCEFVWAARAAFPNPLCGGEMGSTGPQGNRHGCRFLFFRTGVLSKSPASAHGLGGRSPASAKWGGLSFGDFSLATQRKVTRSPKEGESFIFLGLNWRSPANPGSNLGRA